MQGLPFRVSEGTWGGGWGERARTQARTHAPWQWVPVHWGGGLHGGLKEGTGRRREAPVSDAGRPLRRQEEPEREQSCGGRGQNADSPESSALIYRPRPWQRHLFCSEEGVEGMGTGLSL